MRPPGPAVPTVLPCAVTHLSSETLLVRLHSEEIPPGPLWDQLHVFQDAECLWSEAGPQQDPFMPIGPHITGALGFQ